LAKGWFYFILAIATVDFKIVPEGGVNLAFLCSCVHARAVALRWTVTLPQPQLLAAIRSVLTALTEVALNKQANIHFSMERGVRFVN
jgi:hypothetical protein